MSKTLGASVPDDLHDKVDEAASGQRSKSAVVREAVEEYLDDTRAAERAMPRNISGAFVVAASALLAAGYGDAVGVVLVVHLAVVWFWSLWPALPDSIRKRVEGLYD
jgi:Arc/MetJ-type ribon-helix-helix transcriptional regulator